MSEIRRSGPARSCRDIVHVELVPAGPGEEMQAASAAEDLGACRERLPVRKRDAVLAGRLGTIGAELSQSKAVMIRPLAAEQRDAGSRRCQGAGAGDVVVPASHSHRGCTRWGNQRNSKVQSHVPSTLRA